MGDRFRLVANEIEVVAPPASRCRSCRWRARCGSRCPTCATSAEAWLTAGGPHHTVLSAAVGVEELADLAEMVGTELLVIDADTNDPASSPRRSAGTRPTTAWPRDSERAPVRPRRAPSSGVLPGTDRVTRSRGRR